MPEQQRPDGTPGPVVATGDPRADDRPQLPEPIELPVGERASALPLRSQLIRFVLTGGLSAVVDFGILSALMALGLGYTPAKAISFVCGTTTAYLINRRWTFKAEPSRRRFLAVVILYAATFAVQVGLFAWLYPAFLRAGLGETVVRLLAFVIAQGVATIVNFIVQRAVIFRLR